jgi:hypothetical protein
MIGIQALLKNAHENSDLRIEIEVSLCSFRHTRPPKITIVNGCFPVGRHSNSQREAASFKGPTKPGFQSPHLESELCHDAIRISLWNSA